MQDLERPDRPAPSARLDPVDTAIGVITRPASALAAVAAARAWLLGLAVYIVGSLLSGLASLTAPAQQLPEQGLSPEMQRAFEMALSLARSPGLAVVSAVIIGPILLAFWTGILYLIGRLLGGRGPYSGLLATQGFASVPNIPLAPLLALVNLAGAAFAPLAGLLAFAFNIWSLVLSVIGIRESLGLSTGRAVATLLIPLAILFLLACVLAVIMVLLIASTVAGAR